MLYNSYCALRGFDKAPEGTVDPVAWRIEKSKPILDVQDPESLVIFTTQGGYAGLGAEVQVEDSLYIFHGVNGIGLYVRLKHFSTV